MLEGVGSLVAGVFFGLWSAISGTWGVKWLLE